MKKQSSKYFVLLMLLVMFMAPGIAAYVFYQHPDWLSAAKVNKGDLLNPPIALNVLQGQDKWRLVFWAPKECDAVCLKQLDTLARIRLALGRKLYKVDQWLVLGNEAQPLSSEATTSLKALDFQVVQLSAKDLLKPETLFAETKIFLADPHNYLILAYAPSGNPDDVYKDLKLLLNTTEQNG